MEILSDIASTMSPALIAELARYRHQVFVETLGWELACQKGEELDQFDRPDTQYVVARRDDGEIVGTARILPTDRPYLLGDVFPQLMGGTPLPRTADVWEISRFAAVDFDSTATGATRQFSSPVAVALLDEVITLAAKEGVQRLITVSPLGVERLLRRAGFLAHRAAPPLVIDGHPIFACWIEVQAPCSD